MNTTKDTNGLAFTTERDFGDFVYQYLKTVGAATTGDIIKHVSDNYPLLKGDLEKSSEERSSLRFRQTIDNLIKCHGTILKMYGDLVDFPGGIRMSYVVVSDELLDRARTEMSAVALKNAELRKLEEERLAEEARQSILRAERLHTARRNSREWRESLIVLAGNNGFDIDDIKADFNDIVEDVAYRCPDSIHNMDSFGQAFLSQC